MPAMAWLIRHGSERWDLANREEAFMVDQDPGEMFYRALCNIPRQYDVEPATQLALYVFTGSWRVVWSDNVVSFTWPYIDVDDLFKRRREICLRMVPRGGGHNPCGEIFLGEWQADVLTDEAARINAMNPLEQEEYWRQTFEHAAKYLDRPNK